MHPEDFKKLRQVSLFEDISADTLQRLVEDAFLQRFPSQTILFRQGELPDFLHVLLEGSLQLTATSYDQHETVVEILEPVETFVPAAVLTNTVYLVSAKIVRAARILMLPASALRESLARDPNLALAIIGSLSRQYRAMLKQVKNLKLRTSTQRLAGYLLELAAENGSESTVELPHDKRLIAARLGMTPESLSRAFSTLRKLGVEVHGHRVQMLDASKLRRYCPPDQLIDRRELDIKVVAA